MLITLKNKNISLTVDTLGAQMMSILSADGCEYLWQGDSKYWSDRAPNLFPFIGRLTNNCYTYNGKTYTMGIHGFAAATEFTPTEQSENHVVLTFNSNEESRKIYPFNFTFQIIYTLIQNSIKICYRVQNLDDNTMPFGIGGHPGFRVPLDEGEKFEDYSLIFSEECLPSRIGFTPQVYLSGNETTYPLVNNKIINLEHSMFDDDAIILKNMAREVTLQSGVSGHSITVSYPDMPYIGFWHWPKTDAPYVCIEPWSSLPARQDIIENPSLKSDMLQLPAHKTYENIWSITIS